MVCLSCSVSSMKACCSRDTWAPGGHTPLHPADYQDKQQYWWKEEHRAKKKLTHSCHKTTKSTHFCQYRYTNVCWPLKPLLLRHAPRLSLSWEDKGASSALQAWPAPQFYLYRQILCDAARPVHWMNSTFSRWRDRCGRLISSNAENKTFISVWARKEWAVNKKHKQLGLWWNNQPQTNMLSVCSNMASQMLLEKAINESAAICAQG